jgi:hypothetical protein
MDEIITMISQVGFPIVVAMYSLIRLEKTVQENTKVMNIIAERLKVDTERVDTK